MLSHCHSYIFYKVANFINSYIFVCISPCDVGVKGRVSFLFVYDKCVFVLFTLYEFIRISHHANTYEFSWDQAVSTAITDGKWKSFLKFFHICIKFSRNFFCVTGHTHFLSPVVTLTFFCGRKSPSSHWNEWDHFIMQLLDTVGLNGALDQYSPHLALMTSFQIKKETGL